MRYDKKGKEWHTAKKGKKEGNTTIKEGRKNENYDKKKQEIRKDKNILLTKKERNIRRIIKRIKFMAKKKIFLANKDRKKEKKWIYCKERNKLIFRKELMKECKIWESWKIRNMYFCKER